MEPSRESFRSRLLASESWSSPGKERYQQVVRDLVAGKLTPAQRLSLGLLTLALVPLAVLFVWLAVTQNQLPALARILFIESMVFTVIAIAYLAQVLNRGVFNRRNMPTFVASTMWIFAVLLSIHFVALIPMIKNVSIAVHFLGIAMIVLIGAGLQLLRVCVEQSDLNTHERLLEMLYRLADDASHADPANSR